MNVSRTYYLVSIPEGNYKYKGYTAVFDAKTHQLKYKIDRYFVNDHLFLSDDGEELIAVEGKGSFTSETYSLKFYNKDGEARTIFLFNRQINRNEDEGFVSWVTDCYQEPDKLIVSTRDTVYSYASHLLQLKKAKKKTTENSSFKRFNTGFLNADSMFSISRLMNSPSLGEQLAKDLKYQIVSTKEEASKAIYFTLIRNETGNFSLLDISSAHIIDLNTGKWRKDEDLEDKVIQLMTHYTYSEAAVPKGVPYWPCNGVVYLKE
jgi:hypothetical protein